VSARLGMAMSMGGMSVGGMRRDIRQLVVEAWGALCTLEALRTGEVLRTGGVLRTEEVLRNLEALRIRLAVKMVG
jgi:hypothetical protein